MPIIVNLAVMLARRKMRSKELAEKIGLSEQNLSLLKSGKIKGVRFSTLEAICHHLQCQPGELLEYQPPTEDAASLSSPLSSPPSDDGHGNVASSV